MIDTGPVNVRGLITARFARVIHDGTTLYVVAKDGAGLTRQTAVCPEPVKPAQAQGWWRTETDEGSISFSRRGCATCGGKYNALRSIPRQSIIDGTF
jgi:ribosomal protein S27AE